MYVFYALMGLLFIQLRAFALFLEPTVVIKRLDVRASTRNVDSKHGKTEPSRSVKRRTCERRQHASRRLMTRFGVPQPFQQIRKDVRVRFRYPPICICGGRKHEFEISRAHLRPQFEWWTICQFSGCMSDLKLNWNPQWDTDDYPVWRLNLSWYCLSTSHRSRMACSQALDWFSTEAQAGNPPTPLLLYEQHHRRPSSVDLHAESSLMWRFIHNHYANWFSFFQEHYVLGVYSGV